MRPLSVSNIIGSYPISKVREPRPGTSIRKYYDILVSGGMTWIPKQTKTQLEVFYGMEFEAIMKESRAGGGSGKVIYRHCG
jgi:hypothetical protein